MNGIKKESRKCLEMQERSGWSVKFEDTGRSINEPLKQKCLLLVVGRDMGVTS